MDWKMMDFPVWSDDRGSLVAWEENWPVPFEIRRIFCVYGADPDIRRGCHAHMNTRELLVCVCGSCKVTLDNGRNRESISLSCPERGLFVDRLVWIEVSRFSSDCVLLAVTDRGYEETQSIRDFSQFLRIKLNMETDSADV